MSRSNRLRGLQLVGNVLCQLPFQTDLFLFLSDIVDTDFKTHILEDDALHNEGLSVLVDRDGHPFLFFADGAFGGFVDEVRYLFQFADVEYLFCRFKV